MNEAVEQAREVAGRGPAGFVNAVLRRVGDTGPGGVDARSAGAGDRFDAGGSGCVFSPPGVGGAGARRALATHGGRADELDPLLRRTTRRHASTMAALPGLADVPDDARRTPYSPLGFRVAAATRRDDPRIGRTPAGAGRGLQLAALALSRAVPVTTGERWLDLCAGPGGKTAVLAAEACGDGAGLRRTRSRPPARVSCARRSQGCRWTCRCRSRTAACAPRRTRYDRILVDAPCTGLGALRRRPEARWRKSPGRPRRLTRAAARAARPRRSGRSEAGGDRRVRHVLAAPGRNRRSGRRRTREWGEAIEELDARAVITERRMRSPTCLLRPTAQGAPSCGPTATTPTPCPSRCFAGADPDTPVSRRRALPGGPRTPSAARRAPPGESGRAPRIQRSSTRGIRRAHSRSRSTAARVPCRRSRAPAESDDGPFACLEHRHAGCDGLMRFEQVHPARPTAPRPARADAVAVRVEARTERRDAELDGATAMSPPLTPLLAGRPTRSSHSPEKSYMPQLAMIDSTSRATASSPRLAASPG